MAGKSIEDILRQQAAQRQAQIQQQQAQERALYEQRERQRQDYLQRMRMFEALNSINPSVSAAAAGGRSTSVQEFPSVSGQSYIITWADDTDNLWKFVVYNHGTGQLSDTHVTNLVISDWTLNSDSKTVQSKGFTLEFENNNNGTFRIYFVNANGTVVGEKSLDTEEEFQYTERAAGYLGELNGVSTFYHFDGDNVRTHTFPGISVGDIKIDNAGYDDVTADGSMMVEAPDGENYYIARPNGDLVDVSQYFNADDSSFRMDYNTNFIEKASDTYINIVSQEGDLLNSFDLTPFNEASAGANYTIDESWFYGENCGGAEYNEGPVRLFASYDGDSNEFVSLTFPNADERVIKSRRDWERPVSSFGKNLIISSTNENGTDSLGYISNITGGFNMWWLPKGATEFNHIDLTSVGTFSFVLGNGDGLDVGNGFTDNRSFTLGENPIFMYALENSEIIVGFLEEGGFSTQSTGILSASCSNIWGHNIGEHSFAVFDVDYTSNRIWQMYDSNSKVAETQTTDSWSWGDGNTRGSLRNGTLAVIDSDDTSKSFIYTTEIGLTAGPTGIGNIYNFMFSDEFDSKYGISGGITYEYQVITQFIPGEEGNQYVDGFYVLSKSGLSEYVEFGGTSSGTYSVDSYCIGSEMISFRLQDSVTSYHKYQVYNISTLALIHDYQYDNNNTNYYPYDNRFYVEYDDNAGNVEMRLVSLSGVEVLNLQTTSFNREANDAVDNG